MTKTHRLYTLVFESAQGPVIFYVGHTNDPRRRETEHRGAVKNLDNQEYKYQVCRQLEACGINWEFVDVLEIEDDEDTEYAWVLKFARDNQSRGYTFIDDLPLTNMRRGDFLEEILADRTISTASEIKQYRQDRKNRVTSYTSVNIVQTDKALHIIQQAHKLAEESVQRDHYAKSKKITKTSNPMNEESVRKANTLLLKRELEEGSMLWHEYNEEMQRIGYPAWTETPPKLLKR